MTDICLRKIIVKSKLFYLKTFDALSLREQSLNVIVIRTEYTKKGVSMPEHNQRKNI